MIEPKAFWVGFNQIKGIGSVRIRSLLDYFGDLEKAWYAPSEQLLSAGLKTRLVEKVDQFRHQANLDLLWERVQRKGINVLTWLDDDYPPRLKEIDQSPPVLYLRGTLKEEDSWAVAIVGTRRVTPYGRQVTEELGAYLGRHGVTVVSGLARGVDAIAHLAALKAGGRTIAIFGCGVDRIYPPEHRQLADRIMSNGSLISDYPVGTPPEGINFPPRNRIISGLSLATVVIEASEQSGAIITANFAAEQGREVFAVPGNIFAPQSKGTNRLIMQGARPLLEIQDVLEALDLTLVNQHQAARKLLNVDPFEANILQVLSFEPIHIDDICSQLDLPIEKLSAALALMELKGMVRQVGGMNYVAVREAYADYR